MKFSLIEQSAHVLAPPRLLVLGALPPVDYQPFACRVVLEPDAGFDAVMIGDGGDPRLARDAAERSGNLLAPIANLSSAPVAFAELRGGAAGPAPLAEIVIEIASIVRHVSLLADEVRRSSDPALLLLARCATRKGGLRATYDGASETLVTYAAAGLIAEPRRHAESLADAGALSRTFFDRVHVCPACSSSRLNVREECPSCHGAAIAEEASVHHFACAHLALERAFRAGDALVCPKCRKTLRHFGVDYDKPGTAAVCNGCGHVDGEPAVGFRCADCGARHDAEAVATRDWHSYALTPAGEEFLARGVVGPASGAPLPGRGTLCLLIRQSLALRQYSARPMSLIEISFANEGAIAERNGERFRRRSRALIIETVRSELRDIDFAAEIGDAIMIHMPETAPAAAMAIADELIGHIRDRVAADLGAVARPVDPARLLGRLEAGR